MKSNTLLFFLLLGIWACIRPQVKKEENKISEEIKTEEKTVGDKISKVDSSVFSSVKLITQMDSVKHLLGYCSEEYCRLNDHKLYRISKNGNYILEYDPITSINKLFDFNGKKLAQITLSANNPELGIFTVPLEDEPGLLYIDMLNTVKKYNLDKKGELKLSFKIKAENLYSIYTVDNGRLFLHRLNRNKNQAVIDVYSLLNGSLIEPINLEEPSFVTKYFPDANIWIKYNNEQLAINDFQGQKAETNIKVNGIIRSIDFVRNNGVVSGVFMDDEGLTEFVIKNSNILKTRVNLASERYYNNIMITEKFLIVPYLNKSASTTKLPTESQLEQGVIFIDRSTDKKSQLDYPPIEGNYRTYLIGNDLYFNANNKNAFRINLHNI